MSSINIDQLSSEISSILGQYEQNIMTGINSESRMIADKAVKTLKATSPKRAGNGNRYYSSSGKSYSPGSYANGWSKAKEQEFGEVDKYEVHNKGHYRLTHLLENGHITRSGGRTRKIVHIQPVEQMVAKEYENAVGEVIKNASK